MTAASVRSGVIRGSLPQKVVTGVKVASVVDCCSLQSVSVMTSAVVAAVASAVVVRLPFLDDVRRGDSVLKAGGVDGLRAQDVDCSLQSDGGVVDRPLDGRGGVPLVQIVAAGW